MERRAELRRNRRGHPDVKQGYRVRRREENEAKGASENKPFHGVRGAQGHPASVDSTRTLIATSMMSIVLRGATPRGVGYRQRAEKLRPGRPKVADSC